MIHLWNSYFFYFISINNSWFSESQLIKMSSSLSFLMKGLADKGSLPKTINLGDFAFPWRKIRKVTQFVSIQNASYHLSLCGTLQTKYSLTPTLRKLNPKNGLRLAKTLSLEFFILMKLAGTFVCNLIPANGPHIFSENLTFTVLTVFFNQCSPWLPCPPFNLQLRIQMALSTHATGV